MVYINKCASCPFCVLVIISNDLWLWTSDVGGVGFLAGCCDNGDGGVFGINES